MPTSVGPNTFGEENLVFGYDTGDTVNSYRGEPTDNLAPAGGRTGASALPRQSYHVLAWIYSLETNVNGRADVIRMYIDPPGDTGQPYTDFGFQASKPGGSVVGDVYTISFDYYVAKGNSVPSFGSVYADGYKSPTSADVATTLSDITKDLGNGWYRRTRTVELTAAGNTFWRGGISSNNLETEAYIDNIQLEYKGHKTPFVDGTRSATQGLIDLTGNSTIDLTNVSFDSDAQMAFDGSSDYVDLGSDLNSIGSNATFEMVFKAEESNDTYRIMLGWGNGNSNYSGIHIGNWTSGYTDESFHVNLNAGALVLYVRKGHTFYKDNTYHHAIVTAGPNNYAIWIDGVKQSVTIAGGTQSTTFTNIVGYNSNIVSEIGRRPYGNGSGYFNGKLPLMKVYDRILTASEIKANYNAIKGRFNI